MQLVIGNKIYSSWSLRPWIVMRDKNIKFEEHKVRLYAPGMTEEISKYSKAGKVPILIDGNLKVWDSLAIMEYLHEQFPDAGIWPKMKSARVHARCVSAEMHSGFFGIRSACSMNLGAKFAAKDRGEDCAKDVARITEIWNQARKRYGAGGEFLYGAFSAADGMYAPVVARIEGYSIEVDEVSRRYMNAVMEHPAYQEWRNEALKETWVIGEEEQDEDPIEKYR